MEHAPLLYKIDKPAPGTAGNWKITRIFSGIMSAFKNIGRATAEEVRSDIIIQYGTESSRAWTTIATSQPDHSLIGDCSAAEPSFGLSCH